MKANKIKFIVFPEDELSLDLSKIKGGAFTDYDVTIECKSGRVKCKTGKIDDDTKDQVSFLSLF